MSIQQQNIAQLKKESDNNRLNDDQKNSMLGDGQAYSDPIEMMMGTLKNIATQFFEDKEKFIETIEIMKNPKVIEETTKTLRENIKAQFEDPSIQDMIKQYESFNKNNLALNEQSKNFKLDTNNYENSFARENSDYNDPNKEKENNIDFYLDM